MDSSQRSWRIGASLVGKGLMSVQHFKDGVVLAVYRGLLLPCLLDFYQPGAHSMPGWSYSYFAILCLSVCLFVRPCMVLSF